jgi:hypothetical protein
LNAPDRRYLVTVQSTVPDFFQEETAEALRSQVDWLAQELSVDDSFFARLVGTDLVTFSKWRALGAMLPPDGEETLRHLWRTMLHLLSFLNFDRQRVRDLFQETMSVCPSGEESALTTPWCGSSLKTYLERTRDAGIEKVECWVTGLRFGDPYAA